MRLSNCQLVFALLQAAGLAQALSDAGIDADDPRVTAYCERVSAATGRPVRDVLDLSIREAISLRIKVQDAAAAPMAARQPGYVIPGYTDSQPRRKSKQGKDLSAPGQ